MSNLTIYVSTKGKDTWSGLLPEPSADGTDGPVASIYRARNLVKVYHEKGDLTGPALVRIRGGRYFLDEPVFFRPESSYPTTYEAYPGETPTLDAGVHITGWSENVVDGKTVWTADASALIARHGYFKSLFVNGHRCARTRLPKKGYYHIEDVSGKDPVSVNHRLNATEVLRAFTLRQMQEVGSDLHSVVADPRCKNPLAGDFTLSEDSPAFALGFRKINTSDVGPRVTCGAGTGS